MNSEPNNYSFDELSLSLKRELLLLFKIMNNIMDKFDLLESMISEASQLQSDNSHYSSSDISECVTTSDNHHSSITNSSHEECDSTVLVTPSDIGTVNISDFTIVYSPILV